MIISEKYKICFIHMPKTGGMWVKQFLLKLDPSFHKFDTKMGFETYADIPLAHIINLVLLEILSIGTIHYFIGRNIIIFLAIRLPFYLIQRWLPTI